MKIIELTELWLKQARAAGRPHPEAFVLGKLEMFVSKLSWSNKSVQKAIKKAVKECKS